MPTNHYINNFENTQEQRLLDDLIEETIKFHGIDVYWLPRSLLDEDTLYGEDDFSYFDHAFLIEMQIKNVEGFEGEGDFLSRFGVEIRDQVTFTVSRRRFHDIQFGGVGDALGEPDTYARPREGDLIFFPLNKKIFEIQFVEHESMFYPMGTLPVYELRCELFRYSSESITTGIADIDKLETERTYANTNIDSTTNETTAALTFKPGDDNITLEQEADAILDFSDRNPFGDF